MSQQSTERSPLEGPVLYRRGSVYTTVDPGASALIAEGDQVVWVGSEQAADSLQDERMQVVELDGRLITPAFVDSSADLSRSAHPSAAAALGLGAVVHTGGLQDAEALQNWVEAAQQGRAARVLLWPSLDPQDDVASVVEQIRERFSAALVGLRLPVADADAQAVASFCTAVSQESLAPALAVSRADELAIALEGLELVASSAGERTAHAMGVRVDLVGAVELTQRDLERLAAASVTLCLDPSVEAPVAELYRQGIPVVWGTGAALLDDRGDVILRIEARPQQDARGTALLHHPDPQQRISARAAFVAATRGAWRALGGGHPMAGQLASGTPATYAVWEVEALMVQQAEGTGASWSTDPRARTPLLPALEDEASPRCTQTVVDGRILPLS